MRVFLFILLLTQLVEAQLFAMRRSMSNQQNVTGPKKLTTLKLVLLLEDATTKTPQTPKTAQTPRTSRLEEDNTQKRRLGCGNIEIGELGWDRMTEARPISASLPKIDTLCSHDEKSALATVVTIENALKTYSVLRRLFEAELFETSQRKLAGEVFRGESPAIQQVAEIFNNSSALKKFRTSFVKFAISSIRANFEDDNLITLATVLNECAHYFETLLNEPEDNIPFELIVVLKSLRDSVHLEISSSPISVLLGSVFFLRLITPAMAQPDIWCGLAVSAEEQRALIRLAKALQLIANQVDPTQDHPYHSILAEMKSLHQPISDFLNRIAAIPLPIDEAPITRAALIRDVLRTEPGIDLAALDQRVDEIMDNATPINFPEQAEPVETLVPIAIETLFGGVSY